MTQIRNVLWKWYKEAQYFILASQKTGIAKSASDPKLQGFLAEGELGKQYFGQRNFVIYLITADHKVLNEGCEYWDHYWYSVVVQDLATRRIQSYPCKIQKLLRRRKWVHGNFSSPKVIYTDNSLEFGKSCEKYHGIIVLPHLIDLRRTGLPKEQCAEWWKERLQYCVAIWLGWKMVGWFYGMLLLSAKCLRPPGWWEKPHKRVTGNCSKWEY